MVSRFCCKYLPSEIQSSHSLDKQRLNYPISWILHNVKLLTGLALPNYLRYLQMSKLVFPRQP